MNTKTMVKKYEEKGYTENEVKSLVMKYNALSVRIETMVQSAPLRYKAETRRSHNELYAILKSLGFKTNSVGYIIF
jgi:hypothetical protein